MIDKTILKAGDKVIVLTNEPSPIQKGFFTSYLKVGETKKGIPVVNINGEELLCMGIVVKYNEDIFNTLSKLPPIEAWNYIAEPHSQINIKYGITYKTYR
jgi:hypothetical protein